MADFTVQFQNLGAVISRLERGNAEVDKAVAGELYRSAEEIMTAAKELTPVDTGALRASGHVQQPVVQAGKISVSLGFGGPAGSGNVGGDTNTEDVGYAEVQHEDVNLRHTVGQAKYLEIPVLLMKNEVQERLMEAVAGTLSGKQTSGGPITPTNPITDEDGPF